MLAEMLLMFTINQNNLTGPFGIYGGIRTSGAMDGPATITNNTVTGASSSGIILNDHYAQTVTGNTISGAATNGIQVNNTTTLPTISNNNITGATTGLDNLASSALVVTCNWWGTADASQIAAKIIGTVNFIPFLTSANGLCNGYPTPTITIQTPTYVSCNSYDVKVTVQGFVRVGAISLELIYDPGVFQYQGVDLNAAISSASPNVPTPGNFYLGFYGDGVTIPDNNNVLFTLHFTLLPTVSGGTTNLTWNTGNSELAGPWGSPVYVSTFVDLSPAWAIL